MSGPAVGDVVTVTGHLVYDGDDCHGRTGVVEGVPGADGESARTCYTVHIDGWPIPALLTEEEITAADPR